MTFHAMTDDEWQDFVQAENDGPILNTDNSDSDYEYGISAHELWLALTIPDEDDDDSDDTQI